MSENRRAAVSVAERLPFGVLYGDSSRDEDCLSCLALKRSDDNCPSSVRAA